MKRRTALVAAFAAAIALAPTAALAYEAPGFDSNATTSVTPTSRSVAITVTAPAGVTAVNITVTIDGVTDDQITIAGTKSATKAVVNGEAVFTVTVAGTSSAALPVAYAAYDAANPGVLVASGTATLAPNATAAPAAPSAVAVTGSEALPLAIGAGVLAVAGAGAVVVARRSRRAETVRS